jgi:hypothetical protein
LGQISQGPVHAPTVLKRFEDFLEVEEFLLVIIPRLTREEKAKCQRGNA